MKQNNGRDLARIVPAEAPTELMKQPAWLIAMREAMQKTLSAEALTDVMSVQIAKARAGDTRAAGFVMRQAQCLVDAQPRPTQITQNNHYYAVPRPDAPATERPGTPEKIDHMAARAAAGLPLMEQRDRPVEISDDDEKAMRRRQNRSAW